MNPSDIIKSYRDAKGKKVEQKASSSRDKEENKPDLRAEEDEDEDERKKTFTQAELLEEMRDEHNLKLKKNILETISTEKSIMAMVPDEKVKKEPKDLDEFLATLSDKKKKKMLNKIMGIKTEKKDKKDKHKIKKIKKEKKEKRIKVKKEPKDGK